MQVNIGIILHQLMSHLHPIRRAAESIQTHEQGIDRYSRISREGMEHIVVPSDFSRQVTKNPIWQESDFQENRCPLQWLME